MNNSVQMGSRYSKFFRQRSNKTSLAFDAAAANFMNINLGKFSHWMAFSVWTIFRMGVVAVTYTKRSRCSYLINRMLYVLEAGQILQIVNIIIGSVTIFVKRLIYLLAFLTLLASLCAFADAQAIRRVPMYPAASGIAVVQDDYNNTLSVASPATQAFSSNVTSGNKIIVSLVHTYVGCPPTITDSQGNSYTERGAHPAILTNRDWWLFTATAGSTAANTVTATYGCGTMQGMAILEVSGMSAYDTTAGQNTKSNTSSPCDTNAITPSVNGSLVIGYFFRSGASSTFTQASYPIKNNDDTDGLAFIWHVQTTAASIALNINCTADAGTPTGGATSAFNP